MWVGSTHRVGYGVVTVEGRSELAHRVAFWLAEGRWPEPCALHHCDNRICVRRSHLFEGTKLDNTHDMIAKRRGNVPKLSDAQIQEAISARANGETQASIAKRLGVSDSLISSIMRLQK